MPDQIVHIELMIETSTTWGRGLVQGVADYAREAKNWRLAVQPAGRYEKLRLGPDWRGDGIIARVTNQELANDIKNSKAPSVNVSCFPWVGIPQLTVNEQLVGEMAASHLLSCGLRHFAYYGPANRPGYVDLPGNAFISSIENAGFRCHSTHRIPDKIEHLVRSIRIDTTLIQWLELLPKPVGLFTWSDVQGLRITEACRTASIGVPDEVAIISGETDELSSMVSRPTLSSVDPAPYRIGYEAAEYLNQLLSSEPPAEQIRHVSPNGIISKGSSDILAIADPVVAKAMRYIHNNIKRSTVTVERICEIVGVSRRSLETRFVEAIGRSPANEIRRCRIERSKQLLISTDWQIDEIAKTCGFQYPESFSRTFKRLTGMSPRKFRKIARIR